MSTLATADLHSDSDGDGDFVPVARPVKKRKLTKKVKTATGSGDDSGSSSSGSDDDDEANVEVDREEAKLLRAEEAEERKKKAAEAFAAFKDDVPKMGGGGERVEKEEMVDVRRERKFAGEIVVETVSLPKSHPEAIAFLAKTSISAQAPASEPPMSGEGISDETASSKMPVPIPGISNVNTDSTTPSTLNLSTTSAPAPKPLPKGPIKRKPRQSLEQLSAGLTAGKKMTTLEKSQMDWKSHVASSSNVADELATNRRSGGFLEKRDFLERVGDRRNDTLESTKKGGR